MKILTLAPGKGTEYSNMGIESLLNNNVALGGGSFD